MTSSCVELPAQTVTMTASNVSLFLSLLKNIYFYLSIYLAAVGLSYNTYRIF